MVSLTNPIEDNNLWQRFKDYVAGAANQGILWGTNNVPFPEFLTPVSAFFGGTTAGWDGAGTAPSVTNQTIGAVGLYTYFATLTFYWSRIKKFRIRISVNTNGGAPWNQSVSGPYYSPFSFDQTSVAHLASAYQSPVDISRVPGGQGPIIPTNRIRDEDIEDFFNRCRQLYYILREEVADYQAAVCHASCHSSCHNSRSRR